MGTRHVALPFGRLRDGLVHRAGGGLGQHAGGASDQHARALVDPTTGWPGGRLPPLVPAPRIGLYTPREIASLAGVHRRLIAALVGAGLVVGIAGAVFSTARYSADTMLMVSGPPIATQDVQLATDAAAGQKSLRDEIALLRSDAVTGRVAQRMGPATLFPDLAQPRLFGLLAPLDPAEQIRRAGQRIAASLDAVPVPGTGLLRVSFAHPDRGTALRALRTVIDTYLDLRRGLAASVAGQVGRDRDGVAHELADLDTQIQKVRDDYQVIDIAQDITAAVGRLDAVLQHENAVRERQQVVTAELDAARRQLGQTPERVLDSVDRTTPAADQARSALLALKLDREHMVAQYSASYPAIPELDRKIAMLESQVAQASKPTLSATRDVRNPALDVLRNRVSTLGIEASGERQQLDELGFEYQQAVSRVASLREAEAKMHDLQYKRDVLEAVGRQFSVRAANVKVDDSLAQARAGTVEVIQAAATRADAHSDWAWWMLGAPLAGIGLAAAGFVAAHRLRRTYVLARQAERDLRLPALAEFEAADPALERPTSRRQIAQVAGWLADTRMEGRPVFAVQMIALEQSHEQQELLLALAAELGRVHGLRTLVLNVDHAGVAVPLALEGPGLPSYLPGPLASTSLMLWEGERDALADAPEADGAPFDFTAETLANLRESCDMVLVGAAGDASGEAARRLATAADAHVLVLRAGRTDTREAASLRDDLLASGGRMLGFMMTGR